VSRLHRNLLILAVGFAVGAAIAAVTLMSSGTTASVDMTNPESVARAYYLTLYECGTKGAGERYDLTTSTRRTWSRDTYIKIERRSGCEPGQAPSFDVHTFTRVEDEAVVVITATDVRFPLVLVCDESGAWHVDTLRSYQPARAPRSVTT
jgi:hypothetical protein